MTRPKALQAGIALMRLSIGATLCLIGLELFASEYPKFSFFWPTFFFGLGFAVLASLAAKPMTFITARDLLQVFFSHDGTPDAFLHQARVLRRLGWLILLVSVLWVSIYSGLAFYFRGSPWLASAEDRANGVFIGFVFCLVVQGILIVCSLIIGAIARFKGARRVQG